MNGFVVSSKVTADSKEFVAAYERAQKSMGELARAQAEVKTATDTAKASLKAGEISLEQYNLELIKGRTSLAAFANDHRFATKAVDKLSSTSLMSAQAMQKSGYAIRNAGQQVGDFATQAFTGGNIATAFSQQIGQLGFAMSEFGGKAGAVGRFLVGPWGIALTIGLQAVSLLTAGFLANRDAADKETGATKTLKEAVEDLDKVTGRANKSHEQQIALSEAAVRAKLKEAIVTRELLSAELARLQLPQGGRAGNFGAQYNADLRAPLVAQQIADNDKRIAGAQGSLRGIGTDALIRANKASLDPAVKAAQDYEKALARLRKEREAGKITAAQFSARELDLEKRLEAGKNATSDARRAATESRKAERAEESAANKAKREAITAENALAAAFKSTLRELDPAANALREYGDQLDRIAKLEKSGKLTGTEALRLRGAADDELQASQLKALVNSESAAFKELISQPFELTGEAMKDQLADIVKSTGKEIEQVLPRSLSSALGDTLEALGAILPGRVGGKLSGVARAIGSVGNVEQVEKLTSGISSLAKGVGFSNEIATKFGASLGQFLPVYAAGMAIAKPISGLLSSIGIKQSGTGLALGGLVGATIGGLFKSTKKASATLGNVDGSASVTGTVGNSASYRSNASALGGNVGSALNTLVDTLGGTLGDFAVSIGQRKGKFVVDPTGAGRTKGSGTQSFKDQSEAESAALRDAIADGAIKGLSAAVETAIRSSTDVDVALKEALKVQAVEDLIGGLGATLSREFKTFEQQAAERVRIAQKYGFDLVKLEEINAQDRADIFNNTMEQRVGSLKTLLSDLKFGDLFEGSAAEQRNAILKEIDAARVDAEAGKTGAADKVASLTKQLLGVSKDAFGTAGPEYATDRTTAQSTAERIIELETARIQKAADDAKATSDATKATAAGVDETNDLLAINNAQQAQILAAIQSLGLAGVAGGANLANFRVARV